MQPEVVSDQENYRKLNREPAELAPVVALYRDFSQVRQDIDTAREMLADPEMKEFAQQEIDGAEKKIAGIEEELQLMLLPKDPDDGKNIYLEIRAGTGGDESALFAGDLLRMYTRFAEKNRWESRNCIGFDVGARRLPGSHCPAGGKRRLFQIEVRTGGPVQRCR